MTRKTKSFDWILSDLNNVQQQSVQKLDGPVLVLAGAGSGKTRVLTYRIAHLIASGKATPFQIIAMTFTNKAAGEMRERVKKLIPDSLSGMWIGTFHSLCARLLRREADRIGYSHNFSIYDTNDQQALIKTVMNSLRLSAQKYSPKIISYQISRAKNALKNPNEYELEVNNPVKEVIAKVYHEYNRQLIKQNAMDFDDLLIKPIELFNLFPLVKEYYQDKFRYILVDEYQDTNRAQYILLNQLADKHKNICVVGDDDQSIYRWRGADLRNILDFERDYPKCAKYRLEQNYRSTMNILNLAHSVISNNIERHPKKLWTQKQDGDKVSMITVFDEREESKIVVGKIAEQLRKHNRRFADFAILYRINAQSRVLEEAFRFEGIPYIIIGGLKFYERKEIKDILAYLRVLVNPADTISIKRIINYPTRGIGETSIAKIDQYSFSQNISFYNGLLNIDKIEDVQSRTKAKIEQFIELIEKYCQLLPKVSINELVSTLIDELGILREFKEEGTVEAASRAENINELIQAIYEFSSKMGKDASLEEYLQQVALITDIDNWDDRSNAVTLMTMHAAKGLEFPVVFIVGLEDGLFPLSRSFDDPKDLEEERRLFYVGATRAKEKLYLSWAKNKKRFGENRSYKSRFLDELDIRYVNKEDSPLIDRSKIPQKQMAYLHDTMPNYEDESQEYQEYYVGMRVFHQKFKKGTIIKIESWSGDVKLIVNFDYFGTKRLVLPYAKLEIL